MSKLDTYPFILLTRLNGNTEWVNISNILDYTAAYEDTDSEVYRVSGDMMQVKETPDQINKLIHSMNCNRGFNCNTRQEESHE